MGTLFSYAGMFAGMIGYDILGNLLSQPEHWAIGTAQLIFVLMYIIPQPKES